VDLFRPRAVNALRSASELDSCAARASGTCLKVCSEVRYCRHLAQAARDCGGCVDNGANRCCGDKECANFLDTTVTPQPQIPTVAPENAAWRETKDAFCAERNDAWCSDQSNPNLLSDVLGRTDTNGFGCAHDEDGWYANPNGWLGHEQQGNAANRGWYVYNVTLDECKALCLRRDSGTEVDGRPRRCDQLTYYDGKRRQNQ
jgi:hypothetical protein